MRINALVLGKSGAGKSTLLNYLYEKKVAETGTGKPVTQQSDGNQTGIYEHPPITIDSNELVIFDSWGLEADKATEWIKIITKESKKRESSENVEDWFHAVIYCVSSAGARIEDFELYYVIKELQQAGHTVIFALTKADRASEVEKQQLREAIKNCPINIGEIIEVESISEKRRNGQQTQQHGRDKLIEALTRNLDKKLREKFSAHYLEKCNLLISAWKKESLALYDNKTTVVSSITGSVLKEISGTIAKMMDDNLKNLDDWCKEMENKIQNLQNSFSKTLRQPKNEKIHNSISISEIHWDTSDLAARIIAHIVFLGLGVVVAKDTTRDDLEGKLDNYSKKFIFEANKAAAACKTSGRFFSV